MNLSIASLTGLESHNPGKIRVFSVGNTAVTPSTARSCSAGATSWTNFSDRASSFTEVNGSKSSRHCVFSMSCCHRGFKSWFSWMPRYSKLGRGSNCYSYGRLQRVLHKLSGSTKVRASDHAWEGWGHRHFFVFGRSYYSFYTSNLHQHI